MSSLEDDEKREGIKGTFFTEGRKSFNSKQTIN